MNRKYVLIICAFWLLILKITASELKVENLGNYQRILLYLDSSMINFINNGSISKNELSVIIDNHKQKVVYKDLREFEVKKQNFDENEYVLQLYITTLLRGDYHLYYTLRNNGLGSSFKKNFRFKIDTEVDQAHPIILDEYCSQVIEDIEMMNSVSSWKLYCAFSSKPDYLQIWNDKHLLCDIPADTIIVYQPSVVVREKLTSNSTIKWAIGNIEMESKIGVQQVFLLYSGLYNLKDQFDQVRYIATQNDWRKLKKYKKIDDMQAGLDQFWSRYEEKDHDHNSLRAEFYRRVIEADRRFSFKRYKKGWMTDRGRVLIKYGLPDEVIAEPLPLETRPYILWYYYSLDKQFLFQDLKGFGDYELKNIEDED